MKAMFGLQPVDGGDMIRATADYVKDELVLEIGDDNRRFDLSALLHSLDKGYHIPKPEAGWKTDFTAEEKAKLRPMAETLAMLDGNAFFGSKYTEGREHYEYYLCEAYAVYEANGGDKGAAGAANFVQVFIKKD